VSKNVAYSSQNKYKVYIILIDYLSWTDTIQCMESIFANAYTNYQIIVTDNSPSDESMKHFREWIASNRLPGVFLDKYESENLDIIQEREYRARKPKKLPYPIVFIKSDQNLGFSYGNNIGIRYGLLKRDADFFWILNNDTVVDERALGFMILTASLDSSYGIIGSKILFYYQPSIIQSLGATDVTWKGIGNGDYDNMTDAEDINGLIVTRSIMGASILIKRQAVEKIGLMDERFFMHHEESDWCTRAIKMGFTLVINCKSKVFHKEGASTERKRIIKSFLWKKASRTTVTDFLMWGYYSFRNEIYFVKKNFPHKYRLYLIFVLPRKLMIKLLSIFLFNDDCKLKRLYLVLRACYDGIKGNLGKTIDPTAWKESLPPAD
jgi:GT2 family glycosyltransferase